MFARSARKPAEPCAVCAAESITTVWDQRLCGDCHARWTVEAPTSGAIEAKAPPHLVASKVETQHSGTVITLVPGAIATTYTKWTAAWVARSRKVAA